MFLYKSIRDQILHCRKIGQGQPRVIIWTNYDGPKAPMVHTKPQGYWPFGSGEEDFWRVFIYWCGGHLGRDPDPLDKLSFLYPWNLALIGQVVLEKKIFENGGRMDGKPWLEYNLTKEPKGSGELMNEQATV